jgi:diadenosine tetraphosphate (Ap4A) HIT family hydrolase
MVVEHAEPDCPICGKHRGEGPLVGPEVWADEHLLVSHRPAGEDGRTVLGYLFVETRRHAPYLADLTDVEAAAVGWAARRAAFGLRSELGAEFVFSAVVGTGVPHFHQHVFARHAGTPAEYGWMASHQWPDAPRGTTEAVVDLCRRLRPYLAGGRR